MAQKRIDKISNIEMVPIPQKINVPSDVNASNLRIPSTYAEGDADYEDDEGNHVDSKHATYLKLTAKDKRSDLIIGPVEKGGIFKLEVYLDNENHAVSKEKATHKREVILNEDYRAIRYKK
ncbi:MAG: hypothetical protein ACXVHS_07105 [Methanobacterium sp.]